MTEWPWVPMLLLSGVYLAMFTAGELLLRFRIAGADQTRKFSHVAAGAITLTLPLVFSSPGPVIVVVAAFVVFLAATKSAGLLRSVHGIRRPSLGAFIYPVAVAATFVISADAYPRYVIAVLALAVGDAAGGIVGGRWGRFAYAAWGQRKTWNGSLAVVVTMAVLASFVLAIAGAPPVEAVARGLLVGLVAGLVEGALPYGLDNLGVPLATLVALEAGSVGGAVAVVVVAVVMLACALAASRFADRRAAARLDPAGGIVDGR